MLQKGSRAPLLCHLAPVATLPLCWHLVQAEPVPVANRRADQPFNTEVGLFCASPAPWAERLVTRILDQTLCKPSSNSLHCFICQTGGGEDDASQTLASHTSPS